MGSFHEYFSTMPWIALPMSRESAQYASALSSKLSVNSIPQLVVLDRYGNYVTNDAKAQVANVAQDIGGSRQLIQSWKNFEAVPIENANLGMMSSLFSKMKKGYNYVTGTAADDKDRNDADGALSAAANRGGSDLNAFIILSFFQEATDRLKKHPNDDHRKNLVKPLNESANSDYIVPVPLELHRQCLLKEQLSALDDTVSKVSEEKSISVTAKEIQEYLRSLGAKDFTNITSNEETQKKLLDSMSEMNEAARVAFARSVLWSEISWIKQEAKLVNGFVDYTQVKRKLYQSEDGIEIDRSAILEFCGLCTAAVKLPEVEAHLQSGRDVFAVDNSEMLVDERSTPPQRVLQLQQMMLCAIGFEPKFGGEELHRVMIQDTHGERDVELEGSLTSFLMNMQAAAKKAMVEGINEGLSDMKDGGVTKVVSVQYSEKTMIRTSNGEEVSVGDAPPSHARMEQQSDEHQREQLLMAAKAASLQHSIVDELSSMEESQRNSELSKAKEAHESFVQKAMALPPGLERVAFLQNVSSEEQRLLLIHKLWESKMGSA